MYSSGLVYIQFVSYQMLYKKTLKWIRLNSKHKQSEKFWKL